MGTNFYSADGLHIGKKSCGVAFNFHAIPEYGLISARDWEWFILNHDNVIVSDYDEEFDWQSFEKEILSAVGRNEIDLFQQRSKNCHPDDEWQYAMEPTTVHGVEKVFIYTQRRIDEAYGVAVKIWKDPMTGHAFMTGEWS